MLESSSVRVGGGGGHSVLQTPALVFEKISVLDSYFIHRYIIIKYRSVLI